MSLIRKKPYIEHIIGLLTDTEQQPNLSTLKTLINTGYDSELPFYSLLNKKEIFPTGVNAVRLRLNNNITEPGIFINQANPKVCALISYQTPITWQDQNILLYEIDLTNKTYKLIQEKCSITELRLAVASLNSGSGELTPESLSQVLVGSDTISVDMGESGTPAENKLQVRLDGNYQNVEYTTTAPKAANVLDGTFTFKSSLTFRESVDPVALGFSPDCLGQLVGYTNYVLVAAQKQAFPDTEYWIIQIYGATADSNGQIQFWYIPNQETLEHITQVGSQITGGQVGYNLFTPNENEGGVLSGISPLQVQFTNVDMSTAIPPASKDQFVTDLETLTDYVYDEDGDDYVDAYLKSSDSDEYIRLKADHIMAKNSTSVQANLERIDLELEGCVDDIADLNQGKLDASRTALVNIGGLVIPSDTPSTDELVGIGTNGAQTRISLGQNLSITNNILNATGGGSGGASIGGGYTFTYDTDGSYVNVYVLCGKVTKTGGSGGYTEDWFGLHSFNNYGVYNCENAILFYTASSSSDFSFSVNNCYDATGTKPTDISAYKPYFLVGNTTLLYRD